MLWRDRLSRRLQPLTFYGRWSVLTVRYEGWWVLLWRGLKIGLRPLGLLDGFHFCRLSLDEPLPQPDPQAGMVIDLATEADIAQLVPLIVDRYGEHQANALFRDRSVEDFLRQRLRRGSHCYVGRIDGEIVAYNWIFFNRHHWGHRDDVITMADDEALCDDAYTAPQWRGHGIHGALHGEMLLDLQRGGFRRAYTIVKIDKRSPTKVLRHVAWDFYGTWICFVRQRSGRSWSWQVRGTGEPFLAQNSSISSR